MSADNWTNCPRCFKNALQERRDREKAAEDAYGKVSPEEYLRMREAAKTSEPFGESLREDWAIGMSTNGVFGVHYSCSCDVCGFSYTYEFEKKVKANEVAKAAGRE